MSKEHIDKMYCELRDLILKWGRVFMNTNITVEKGIPVIIRVLEAGVEIIEGAASDVYTWSQEIGD